MTPPLDFKEIIQPLELKDNSILLVKKCTGMSTKEDLSRLKEALKSLGLRKMLIIVTDSFEGLKYIDEKKMNEYGWYRK